MSEIIFINTIPSGLGDRFMDIILYYTYSSFLKYNKMYYIWNKNYSYECLNINLIKKYLELPNNLIIDTEENINIDKKNIFDVQKYKCGTSSIFSFINYFLKDINNDLYNLFLENKEEEKKFIKLYFNNFKKIKFKNISINISNEILQGAQSISGGQLPRSVATPPFCAGASAPLRRITGAHYSILAENDQKINN